MLDYNSSCVILCCYFATVHSIKIVFGDCPIYYQEPCSVSPVKFILSVPSSNGSDLYQLDPFKPVLPRSFNILVPIKIVVHGYGGVLDFSSRNVSQAYQDVGFNLIIVDWSALAPVPCYPTAYLNTWHVGQCLAVLSVSLAALGITPDIVHVVGFSLGAHVAGLAGNQLKNTLGISYYRITGLDPALPFFATLSDDWKLDSGDAEFVDVVHTSAGTFGKIEATGHVDFYVNGGSLQPFCHQKRYPPLCSHMMAGIYFSESIRNSVLGGTAFIAKECYSIAHYYLGLCESGRVAVMGERVDRRLHGTYFLTTSSEPPFALGENGNQFVYMYKYRFLK